jgi:hypothetical protein
MNDIDKDLKEAFARHATDVSARPDSAWSGVERGVRRAHRRRFAAVSGVAVAAAVAAVVVGVPALRGGGSKPGGFASQPGGQPTYNCDPPNACATASPGVPARANVDAYRDETGGWQALYPTGFDVGRFEMSTEFWPKSLPSPNRGEPTFFVSVQVEIDQTLDDVRARFPDATPATIGKRDALVMQRGPRSTTYYIAWNDIACALPPAPSGNADGACATRPRAVLNVQMTGSTAAMWDAHSRDGAALVDSIEALASDGVPARDTNVATRDGTVDGAVTYDANARALVRFLDARVEGGAEPFAIDAAATKYASPSSGLGLYADPETRAPWQSYAVVARADSGTSTTFRVRMSGGADGMIEELTVGRAEGGAILVTDAKPGGRFP